MNFIMMKNFLLLLLAYCFVAQGCSSHAENQRKPPSNALERLQAGNQRFAEHHALHPDQSAERVAETSKGQKPFAVVITCADSRVSPEIIFDEGIGDLFVIRNAGNIVDEEDVLASVEYAVEHLGVRTVVVMGHERCGAIEAMTHENSEGEPEHIVAIIERLKNEPEEQEAMRGGEKGEQLVHKCVIANVEHGVSALQRQLQHLAEEHAQGENITIAGAVYDVQTGVVYFLNNPHSAQ